MHNLSRVERELMVHISLGLKYPAIAKEMGYSEHTLRDMNK